jgi:hypothetical protein
VPEFNIDPGEQERRKSYLDQMQSQLERTLAAAKTADMGLADAEKDQQLRQIVEESQPEIVEVEKLTAEGAEAIRESHGRTDSTLVRQQRKVAGFLGWLASTVEGLFAKKEKRKTQCENYGHNFPWGTKWEGPHPKCLDCGAEILSADQLRKASSKDAPPY